MVSTVTNESKWQRRKDARPSEIIEAALELFAAKGFKATKLDEVADRAGVSKGTVYLYFDSKETLFREVVSQTIIPELVKAELLVEQFSGKRSELLRTLVLQWWNALGTRLAGIPKLMVSEAANFPELAKFYLDNVIIRGRKLITKIINDGIASGEFKKVDTKTAVRLLISAVIFAAIWKKSLAVYDEEQYDEDAYLDMHLEFFLNGIRKK